MRTLIVGASLLVNAIVVIACGPDSGPGGGSGGVGGGGAVGGSGNVGGSGAAGGGGGAGAMGAADCAHIDYASYAAAPAVSFRTDVLPIFGFQCTQSSCHRPGDHKAGLILGNRCGYDMAAKWLCTFPATPTFIAGSTTDVDVTQPQPLDPAMVMMVRASLLAPSQTVNGGGTARVVPMHPETSFLMQKLADAQNKQAYSCMNQDPSRSNLPCGDYMPLSGELFCQGSYRARFDAIAAWIAQGALDN